MLTGYKTFIAMFISGTAAPWIAAHGFTLTTDQTAYLSAGAVAVVGIFMRFFTKTPVATSTAQVVANVKATGQVAPGVITK